MLQIRAFFNALRHDPEALFELRQLVFGLIIVVGVTYAFHFLYVQSKEKFQSKLKSRSQQLHTALGDGSIEKLTALQLEESMKKQTSLKERVEQLRFQEQMLREQYIDKNSSHSFAKVIFTLLPTTPVNIENEFVEMSVLDTRTLEYYKIHPVNIQGDAPYADFLSYLQYVESRPEVGVIESLRLEQLKPEYFGQNVQVHFDLVLGRIQLNE